MEIALAILWGLVGFISWLEAYRYVGMGHYKRHLPILPAHIILGPIGLFIVLVLL